MVVEVVDVVAGTVVEVDVVAGPVVDVVEVDATGAVVEVDVVVAAIPTEAVVVTPATEAVTVAFLSLPGRLTFLTNRPLRLVELEVVSEPPV